MLCTTTRSPLSGEPSTCLIDTVIVPLPSILLLAFFALYIPFKLFKRAQPKRASYASSDSASFDAYAYVAPGEPDGLPSLNWRAEGLLPKWAHYLYIGLAVCLLGLRVLEAARLIAAKMGLGLLPFGIVASILVVAALLYPAGRLGLRMGRRREVAFSLAFVIYWALSTITETVKVVRLVSYNQVHPAKGTMYPSSDWLLDNACMLGLFGVFLVFETAHCVLSYRSTYIPGGLQRVPKRVDAIGKPTLMYTTAM